MTLIIAEEVNGTVSNERGYSSTTITLGRDPECEIVFNAERWPMVSRKHAQLLKRDGSYWLEDAKSRFGTFVNGERLSRPTEVSDGSRFQLGPNGPVLIVLHVEIQQPSSRPPEASKQPAAAGKVSARLRSDRAVISVPGEAPVFAQKFTDAEVLTIGRGADNHIRLDGLQISTNHARLQAVNGEVFIEDVGSTNGVYVNGKRISRRTPVDETDTVQIGPFVLLMDQQRGVAVVDSRSRTRIDAIDITKVVANRAGGGTIKLLDDVDLAIQPNEFVGLLGPSGAGKSTLMDSLNGMRPASSGIVLINNQDLYEHLDALKQSIGYVPQDDIIHRELTVYRTLYYVARLRLSRDISPEEIDRIINEVMDVTGLSERREVPVGQLSGGQRKRVSIAVELITKPSIIFLDEPTSGLDPATEEKIMKLFRHIAESGRTVVLTTHAMENVKLFDKIVVLMRGKLVFYGAPHEALNHVGAESFKDLYDKLEAPINEALVATGSGSTKAQREQIAESVAEDWKRKFTETEQYKQNILLPLGSLKGKGHTVSPSKHRPTVTDALRQWKTLARRYIEVLKHDKFNLLILFGQAPIVAFLTYLVVDKLAARDFIYFIPALVAVWFGTSIAAREIIRERAVYNRERMVNLGLVPYVGSKLLVLSVIVGLQCVLLFGLLRVFDIAGLMKMPGEFYGLPQLGTMFLAAIVGVAMGLFISAVVKTSEMATSLVPLLLIPQIIFSGLIGVPKGPAKYVGAFMPATWAFDEMKRFSELDVLRGKDEKAMASSKNEGRGLFKDIEHQNDQLVEQKQSEVENYKTRSEDKFEDFDREMNDYQKEVEKWNMGGRRSKEPVKPKKPTLDPVPGKVEVVDVPEDLSGYVDFLHPWGGKWLNPAILLFMFMGLTAATIAALRSQDIG